MYLKLCRKMILVGGLAVALSACSGGGQTQSDNAAQQASSAAADNAPTILVCTEASYAPFEFRDKNGLVIGYDVDVLNAIGKNQGFKTAFVIRRWDDLFTALQKGECDVVAASLTITDERRQTYSMSNPYGKTTSVVLTIDPKINLKTPDDIHDLKVATKQGTYTEEYLRKHGVTDFVMVSSTYLALKAVVSGQAQAATGDAEVLSYYLRQEPSIRYRTLDLKLPADQKGLGFLMRKDDKALLTKVNTGLQHIAGNGTLAELQKKWLGTVQKLPSGQNTDTPAASAE